MSDILVRGIEMPNTCKECIIGNPKNKTCYILGLPKRNLKIREDCPLAEIETPHGDLIDKEKLYEQTAEWEAQALEQASKLARTDNTEEWRRWHTILNERTAFKHDVYDAPVVIEGNL